LSALLFKGRRLSDLDDAELDAAETYTLDAILATSQHYRLMTAAYEAISREMAKRIHAA
jgi:hypothetical protein